MSPFWRLLAIKAKVAFATVACGVGLVWGIGAAPFFWQDKPVEDAARSVVAGQSFRPEVLAGLLPQMEKIETRSFCRPSALRGAAIIRLRLAEIAISESQRLPLQDRMKSLREVARASISCSPYDPFLWLVLYWVELQNDSTHDYVPYLKMSYRFGANEGWVAAKRNSFALAIYEQLPADLKESVAAEFALLVNSGFIEEAAANLTGPGWPVRQVLLDHLGDVRLSFRRRLARALLRSGIRLQIPGVEQTEARPWD